MERTVEVYKQGTNYGVKEFVEGQGWYYHLPAYASYSAAVKAAREVGDPEVDPSHYVYEVMRDEWGDGTIVFVGRINGEVEERVIVEKSDDAWNVVVGGEVAYQTPSCEDAEAHAQEALRIVVQDAVRQCCGYLDDDLAQLLWEAAQAQE